MASREYLQITQESSYGTSDTPTVGTNSFFARLHEDDTFTGMEKPVLLPIPYGGGRTTPAQEVSDQKVCMFAFKTYLYPGAYSAMLLAWATGVINSGRSTPWVTTDASNLMPPGDLASLYFRHAYQRNDGTYKHLAYNGAKCLTYQLSASRQDPRWVFSCTGQAIGQNSDTITAPTETQYPTGCYLFSHTGGNVLLIDSGTTPRSQYDAISISGQNTMDPNWFESTKVQLIKFCGRSVTTTYGFHLKATPDDLALFQAVTPLKHSVSINNGVNSLAFDFKSNNYIQDVTRNLPLGRAYKQQVQVLNFWDASAGTDFTLTAA